MVRLFVQQEERQLAEAGALRERWAKFIPVISILRRARDWSQGLDSSHVNVQWEVPRVRYFQRGDLPSEIAASANGPSPSHEPPATPPETTGTREMQVCTDEPLPPPRASLPPSTSRSPKPARLNASRLAQQGGNVGRLGQGLQARLAAWRLAYTPRCAARAQALMPQGQGWLSDGRGEQGDGRGGQGDEQEPIGAEDDSALEEGLRPNGASHCAARMSQSAVSSVDSPASLADDSEAEDDSASEEEGLIPNGASPCAARTSQSVVSSVESPTSFIVDNSNVPPMDSPNSSSRSQTAMTRGGGWLPVTRNHAREQIGVHVKINSSGKTCLPDAIHTVLNAIVPNCISHMDVLRGIPRIPGTGGCNILQVEKFLSSLSSPRMHLRYLASLKNNKLETLKHTEGHLLLEVRYWYVSSSSHCFQPIVPFSHCLHQA